MTRLHLRAPPAVQGVAHVLLLAAMMVVVPGLAGAQLAAVDPIAFSNTDTKLATGIVDPQSTVQARCILHIGVDTVRRASSDSSGVSRSPVRCPSFVATWDTVRLVLADGREVHGVLTRADSTGMYVSPTVGRDSLFYPIATIQLARVRTGFRARGASVIGEGAVIGLGVGIVITAAMVGNANRDDTSTAWVVGVMATGATSLAGAVIGALVAVSRGDQWAPFDPRTFRIVPDPAADELPRGSGS